MQRRVPALDAMEANVSDSEGDQRLTCSQRGRVPIGTQIDVLSVPPGVLLVGPHQGLRAALVDELASELIRSGC